VNGAAATGTQRTATRRLQPATAGFWLPFTEIAVVSGLTLGTAVWFDMLQAAQSGTAQFDQISMSAWEL
jgi:hypothetical protein